MLVYKYFAKIQKKINFRFFIKKKEKNIQRFSNN